MKIVFIASAASIHSIKWINFFVDGKNEIYLITTTKPNHETKIEIEKIRTKINLLVLNNLKNFFKIPIFLIKGNYSLVHIHYLGWHSLLSLFINSNSKLIITPWGSDILKKRTFLKNIWLRILFKKSNFMICDSERLVNESIKLGLKKSKTMVTMFGVDTNLYRKSRDIFTNNNCYYVGSNRKLEDIYDVKTFIKAAKLICQNRDDIFFYIAGNGSLEKKYRKEIEAVNLKDKIKFLGLLNKSQMIDFYNNIDIYVSTSLSDGGLAASIAEAMSFERLIIASNNSDNKIWIKNKQNGYLFESGDYKKLSNKIIYAIENKKNSIIISKSSRDLIVENYSYEKEMKRVNEKYIEILSK